MANMPIEILQKHFSYDPETGKVFWIKPNSSKHRPGMLAGSKSNNGYLYVQFNKKAYGLHRVIWAIHYGEQPPSYIDHINGDRSDNRIANLRSATKVENGGNRKVGRNNTSGYKGVTYRKDLGLWQARITHSRKVFHLGFFDNPQVAHQAYINAADRLHGKFARYE